MAIIPIRLYPDPVLREVAKEILEFDEKLEELTKSMFETMYDAPGIGLAGPQIGESLRIFVVDIGDENDKTTKNPLVFINPKITKHSGETKYEEGCLSLPGIREFVHRPSHISITAKDVRNKEFSLDADGLLAIAIQHELDHLDGILFTDHLSGLKKKMANKKLEKLANR